MTNLNRGYRSEAAGAAFLARKLVYFFFENFFLDILFAVLGLDVISQHLQCLQKSSNQVQCLSFLLSE